jgi:DNA-binding response OmpR family regulator
LEKIQIIVVDDDIKMRKLIKDVLRKEYEVRAVESVESAFLEIEQGFAPKVSIVDYMLPGKNGDEFIKRVSSDVCVHIMITAAEVNAKFRTEMMKKGAMYVLKKPFSFSELRAMVRNAAMEKDHVSDHDSR